MSGLSRTVTGPPEADAYVDAGHGLHAAVDRTRSRRRAFDRGDPGRAGRRRHLPRHRRRLLPRRHRSGPQRAADRHCAGNLERRSLAHRRCDQGRPDAAERRVGARRPRATPGGRVRGEPPCARRRADRSLPAPRARSAHAVLDQRPRARGAEARRPDRLDRLVQRHRRPDRGRASDRRDCRRAGRAQPLARRQYPQRRRRLLRRQRHPPDRAPAARRTGSSEQAFGRSGAGCDRRAPRRVRVRRRARVVEGLVAS